MGLLTDLQGDGRVLSNEPFALVNVQFEGLNGVINNHKTLTYFQINKQISVGSACWKSVMFLGLALRLFLRLSIGDKEICLEQGNLLCWLPSCCGCLKLSGQGATDRGTSAILLHVNQILFLA